MNPVIGAILFARDLVSPAPLSFAQDLRSANSRIEELCARQK